MVMGNANNSFKKDIEIVIVFILLKVTLSKI